MKTLLSIFSISLSLLVFSQIEEEWTFEVDSISVSGTLLTPSKDFRGPVVLFFSGSGVTDRNGNTGAQFQNNSLKMLAEALVDEGLASFRFDKRSIPLIAAGRVSSDMSFDYFVDDGITWLTRLKSDGRFDTFFVLGHSQGSTVGALVARDSSISKFISVAGPARPADEVIYSQLEAQSPLLASLAKPKLDSIKAGYQVAEANAPLHSLFKKENQPFMSSWFNYDPKEIMTGLNKPVLIVNGTTDFQVSVIEAEALNASVGGSNLLIIEGMNHVLKDAPKDRMLNMAAYSDPNRALSDGLVDGIVNFLAEK
ncbi:MAG: lysophospholipase [Flavobacteriales bacterium]|nr:lysophospholipase [Flavobacteriales bacterium]